MLTRLAAVVEEATASFDDFDYARALERTEAFFWWFCDDYVELVKSRAYGARATTPAQSALVALRTALDTIQRLFAPILPFVTDEVWSWWQSGSVHTSRLARPPPRCAPEQPADPAVLDAVGEVLSQVRRKPRPRPRCPSGPPSSAWTWWRRPTSWPALGLRRGRPACRRQHRAASTWREGHDGVTDRGGSRSADGVAPTLGKCGGGRAEGRTGGPLRAHRARCRQPWPSHRPRAPRPSGATTGSTAAVDVDDHHRPDHDATHRSSPTSASAATTVASAQSQRSTTTNVPRTTTTTTTTIPALASGTWITAPGYNPEWHSINPPWVPEAAGGLGRRPAHRLLQVPAAGLADGGQRLHHQHPPGVGSLRHPGLRHLPRVLEVAQHLRHPQPVDHWHYMVRFAVGPQGGGIGLHEIPCSTGTRSRRSSSSASR